jgi:putative intracellular protease/amidase
MTLKKKLMIIAGGIVGVIIILFAFSNLILQGLGLHPDYHGPTYRVGGKKALVITTSHDLLAPVGETEGKASGVAISEMTHPYYVFLDAGMDVDLASIKGGEIPIDPQTVSYPIISGEDRRFLKDPIAQAKAKNSIKIDDIDFAEYDAIFLAGGWGAAYDLAQSDVLAQKISDAYYSAKKTIIGGVCHGPLGLVNARDKEGNLLIAGRKMTGVTDKQVKELGIEFTPKHPETELKKAGAILESSTAFNDFFATHVAVDDEKRFVTGQNQNSGLETAHKMTELLANR